MHGVELKPLSIEALPAPAALARALAQEGQEAR
jgi:hypothetical protein